jgi:hypothetical protein
VLVFLAGLTDKGLAPNTRRQIKTTLVMALDAAVDARLIAVNPAAGIRTKRPRPEKRVTLSQDQCRTLLDETRGTRLYVPALLAIAGGLRRGEICALKWAAVDLEQGTIDVRENMVTVKGETIIGLPKSGDARTVAVPANVCGELRTAKRRQAEELLRVGVRQTPNTLAVDGIEGPMSPTAITLAFGRLMRRLRSAYPSASLQNASVIMMAVRCCCGPTTTPASRIIARPRITRSQHWWATSLEEISPNPPQNQGAPVGKALKTPNLRPPEAHHMHGGLLWPPAVNWTTGLWPAAGGTPAFR